MTGPAVIARAAPRLRVAIMQPYFIPYAGYFRLLAASDLFVLYDCVQFPRRGWVHRNRLPDAAGRDRWLTLPLAAAPQSVVIRDLRFSIDVREALAERQRRFPVFDSTPACAQDVVAALRNVDGTPVDYLEQLLRTIAGHLGLHWRSVRSSTLDLPATLRGQDRILAIARHFNATCYVNAPGGRGLYDPKAFADADITLRFLRDYAQSTASILQRIVEQDAGALAHEIRSASELDP